jgi:hypothetical protein
MEKSEARERVVEGRLLWHISILMCSRRGMWLKEGKKVTLSAQLLGRLWAKQLM